MTRDELRARAVRSYRESDPKPAVRSLAEGTRAQRGLAVDTLGLIIAVVVMAASATDNQIGVRLLDLVVAHTPTVSKA